MAVRIRTIRLIRPPTEDAPGVFCIREGSKATYYTFREIPCEIGGRAFAVHRTGLGSLYHVRVGAPRECSCECLGFLTRRKCKHIAALLAITGHGLL